MTHVTAGPVIHVKNAYKYYGASQVLGGVNMSVQPGTIYGLLGPSGCGKTTLMNCIVGQSSTDAGSIQLSFSDYKNVGFMPQEISLHSYLSVEEIMLFYGYLFSMSTQEIKKRAKHLYEILNLPPLNKAVSSLSGGQQRRVSLAVALLHDPKVLILDEPTVGLDPVLSSAIWDRLQEMSSKGKTIIVSTHYIEEARKAHTVGLMRNGRMLIEDSPRALLQRFNAEYLEDVFVVLCVQDNEDVSEPPSEFSKSITLGNCKKTSLTRIKAQIWKNICLAKRNFLMTLFIIILPITLNCCVHISYGHDPFHLPIGVINKEFQDSLQSCPRSYTNNCILYNEDNYASCAFINGLRDRTYQITEYEDFETAAEDFKSKRILSVLSFASNFTESLALRTIIGVEAYTAIIESGSATALVDKADHLLYKQIVEDFLEMMEETLQSSLQTCVEYVKPRALQSVIQLKTFYGSIYNEMAVHFIIGFNIINIFFCPLLYACAMLVDEKDQGVIDRILCSGTTMKEIMISHMTFQTAMLVVHTIELYVLTYYIFDNPEIVKNSSLIMTILIITAVNGAILGTTIGLITEHLMIAVNIGCVLNMCLSFTTGLFWPIEGAHPSIQRYLRLLPMTGAITASRCISLKGCGLDHPEVVEGITTTIAWCVITLVLLCLILKTQKGHWNTRT